MEDKENIKELLIKFCIVTNFGACDVEKWVKENGVKRKHRDTVIDIEYLVEMFLLQHELDLTNGKLKSLERK